MKNIAVVCGGFSGEDVISFKSADTIIANLDSAKYNVYRVEVSKQGWKALDESNGKLAVDLNSFSLMSGNRKVTIDAVINVIHGTPGEDGNLQGLLNVLGIPNNGSGVLASALGFNKGFCNHFLKQQGVNVANSLMFSKDEKIDAEQIVSELGLPCFVKPNDAGSSLGVSKVERTEDLMRAINHAFSISERVLIESNLDGIEITCGVINYNGEATPVAVTEIVFESDFFDFDAKYTSSTTQEITPARINPSDYDEAMAISKHIYRLLGCTGFFRADYMLTNDGLFLIEVNTVPGMSDKSLMPQQLEYANYKLSEVLDQQINNMLKSR